MGNSSQGVVLPGQVQAVKEGTGIDIAADGTISVDEGDLVTFVRLNNGAAYNNYVWPNVVGASATFLMTDSTGNLSWQRVRVPVTTVTPTSPVAGEMWFDCSTGEFKVYESCTTGTPKWTPVSQPGLAVLPANTSANPAFTGGSGTSGAPYQCTVTTIPAGSNIFIVNEVTIIGLAPNQYVPIVDLNAVTNGGRYSFTNNYADATGTLKFQTVFKDQPASPAGTTYTANIKVGWGTVYISAQVGIVSVISISDPGTISGTPEVGRTLTYTIGSAAGGTGVYTYTWEWIQDSNNGVLQTGGANYVIPPSLVGDQVYVRLTATDTVPQSASANTDLYPAGAVITKGPFPNPTPPSFPGEIGVDSCFTWDGSNTTLESDGCIEFNVNGGGFSQTAKAVATNDVVCTRWVDVPSSGLCGDAPNGTVINGCLFDATHEACGTLTIDRVPSTFPPFATITDHVASTVATSNGSTPYGYNATSFVTGSLSAGASTLQGSINGGAWTNIPASGETFGINPGDTLQVRFTTGASSNTTYVATINLGQSPNFTTQTFTVVNDAVPFPSTPINFPTFIPDVAATTWNEPGTTPLTANGCIEMATAVGGPYSQSLSISLGNTLYTRWISSAACAGKAAGPITGCIFSAAYEECDTLNINRVPTNFPPIPAVTGTLPGAYATSASVTPTGTTAPSYLTTSAVAGVSNIQASINGGATWTAVPTSGSTFQVPPHSSIEFRYQGANPATTYTVPFKLGDGISSVTQNFVVTTGKAPFPAVDIVFPSYIPQIAQTTWAGGATTLTSNGCIQISLNGTAWGTTAAITNGATLYTRWNPSAACGGLASGTISGCVYNATYEECGSLVIDRVPATFPAIPAVTGVTPATYGTSSSVTPTGQTAPSYVTVASVPAGVTNIQASTNGGATWFGVGTAVSASAIVNPNDGIEFRFIGATPLAQYDVEFRLGDGTNYNAQVFSVTNGTAAFPNTGFSPATGPNAAPASVNVGALKGTATATWADGSVNLTITGDLVMTVNGGPAKTSASPAFPVANGNTIAISWGLAAINAAADGATLTGSFAGGIYQNNYSIVVNRAVGAYDFTNLTGQALTTAVTSNVVTPSGFNVPVTLSATATPAPGLTSIQAAVDGNAFAALNQTVNPGDTIQLKATTGGTVSTTYRLTTTLGTGANATDVWAVATAAAVATITAPTIQTPTANATNVGTAAGITITADAYVNLNGAGSPQTSSKWEVYKWIGGAGPVAPTTDPPAPAQYTAVTGSPFTKTTAPLTSLTIAKPPLEANTTYYVRAQYATTNATATTSAWGAWSGFTTGSLTLAGTATLWKTITGVELQGPIQSNGTSMFCSVLRGPGATTADGGVYTSPVSDGVNWTSTLTLPNICSLSKTSAGYVIAGGSNSGVRLSANGTAWSTVHATGAASLTQPVVSSDGTKITLLSSSELLYSGNGGANWTTTAPSLGSYQNSSATQSGAEVSGTWYLAVGGVPNSVARSTNPAGGVWSSASVTAPPATLVGVAAKDSSLIVSGYNTAGVWLPKISTDGGVTFNFPPGSPSYTGTIQSMAYAGGKFFAMGTVSGAGGYYYSSDGQTWTAGTSLTAATGGGASGISFIPGVGYVMTVTQFGSGKTWLYTIS